MDYLDDNTSDWPGPESSWLSYDCYVCGDLAIYPVPDGSLTEDPDDWS